MPPKSKAQSKKPDKGLTVVGATIVAAVIAGAAAIAAALIATYGHNSSAPPTAPASSPASNSPTQPSSGTMPETVEYPVSEFANYASLSNLQRRLSPGEVLNVYCRIPGDSATPSSVGRAGWYRIQNSNGSVGYAAANTFYNDPGNGRSMQPNNNAFDSAVPIC
jgi:hypothetical protein